MAMVGFCGNGQTQGFVNLDFNSPQLSAYGAGPAFVPAANAIPGWTDHLGTNQQTTVLYNALSGGVGDLAIIGTNCPESFVSPIPDNNYNVVLQSGPVSGGEAYFSSAIAQTGLIPLDTESILFEASLPSGVGWQVTIGGQVIHVSQISSLNSAFAVYGGDVSMFAGQVVRLEFTALASPVPPNDLDLDAISFSSSPVPEPGVFGLSALGALILVFRNRRKPSEI